MSDSAKFNEQVLNYVEKTSQALGVAIKLAEDSDARTKAAVEKVAGVKTRLRTAGLIDEDDVKRAEAQLADHAQTLDILDNVVEFYEGKLKEAGAKIASASLGRAANDTDSGSKSRQKHANYVGRRAGYEDAPKESDLALLKLLDK